jgi:hypothetical protein
MGPVGCAALTNPVADGIPVRNLPPEYLGEPRANLKAVPLGLLRQPPPDAYRLAPGDVLGIVVEGVLGGGTGERREAIPVRLGDLATSATPAQGFPVPVREDGTVALPQVPPIAVDGLTLPEATAEIRKAYSSGPDSIFQPGKERVTVDLLQPRQYSVLVVREDGGMGGSQTTNSLIAQLNQVSVVTGSDRRGTGTPLRLPAYENDILNALTRTGGLPGLECKNYVLVHRAGRRPGSAPPGTAVPAQPEMIRIPIRMPPGPPPTIRLDDIILGDGDIVYVEARGTEVYYTGGILGAAQVPLPRDYDIDVIQAIAIVRGPIINGGFTQNAFVASAVNPGLGNPNPTLITVIRQLPDGKEVRIRIDMARALRDPQERIRVLPGDLIILQETPEQAITRYLSGAIQFNLFATLFQNERTTSIASGTFP